MGRFARPVSVCVGRMSITRICRRRNSAAAALSNAVNPALVAL